MRPLSRDVICVLLCAGFVVPACQRSTPQNADSENERPQAVQHEESTADRAPINIAAESGDIDRVLEELDAGADVNQPETGDECTEGMTPLHWAALNGDKPMIELLLDRGADVNALKTTTAETPLMAGIASRDPEVVRLLLDAGADVNALDIRAAGPLWAASSLGETEIVKMLIARGARVNEVAVDGSTPLMQAVRLIDRDRRREVVRFLLSQGAVVSPVDEDGKTALHHAAEQRPADVVVMDWLVKAGVDIDARDIRGETALMHLCWSGLEEATDGIALLLDGGADPNVVDNEGNSPLNLAAGAGGNVGSVRLLLEAGADIDHAGKYGYTPLMQACISGNVDIVRVLVDAGADTSIRNDWHDRAIDFIDQHADTPESDREKMKAIIRSGAGQQP